MSRSFKFSCLGLPSLHRYHKDHRHSRWWRGPCERTMRSGEDSGCGERTIRSGLACTGEMTSELATQAEVKVVSRSSAQDDKMKCAKFNNK